MFLQIFLKEEVFMDCWLVINERKRFYTFDKLEKKGSPN